MSSTFRILFYLRKNRLNRNGKAIIMVRVTINGERTTFSSKIDVDPSTWNTKSGLVKGRAKVAFEINNQLEEIQSDLRVIFNKISKEEKYVTAEKVKNEFLGYSIRQQTIIKLFEQYNSDMQKMVGISKSQNTVYKYERTCERLKDFMKVRYNVSDLTLKEINHMFLLDFEAYLRCDCAYSENTASKYIRSEIDEDCKTSQI